MGSLTIPERPQTSGLRSTRISTNYKTQQFKHEETDTIPIAPFVYWLLPQRAPVRGTLFGVILQLEVSQNRLRYTMQLVETCIALQFHEESSAVWRGLEQRLESPHHRQPKVSVYCVSADIFPGKFCRNDPRSCPVIHKTQLKQFIALKIHFIRDNPCSAIERFPHTESLIISTATDVRPRNTISAETRWKLGLPVACGFPSSTGIYRCQATCLFSESSGQSSCPGSFQGGRKRAWVPGCAGYPGCRLSQKYCSQLGSAAEN